MRGRTYTTALIALASSLFAAGAAAAPAQRTFVASNGIDSDPCSIVAPCRAFTAALAQTLPGGEVIVLDSAGHGPVTVTQSVSIIAPPGAYAGISVPATGNATGVMLASPGISVVLRGLAINSTGGVWESA